MTKLLGGVALAALIASMPAYAESPSKDLKKMPQAAGQPANSGPGVQGPPDTRTGPSTKSPGGAANEGASSGEAGSPSAGASSSTEHTTDPSQDSSGVKGLPGNKSGESLKEPGDGASGSQQ